jgi:hypothetical protein
VRNPVPKEGLIVPGETDLTIFIPPTPENPCFEITIKIPEEGEKVKPATVPVLRYQNGTPVLEDRAVNVPSGKDGDSATLFYALFDEIASLKQTLHDGQFRKPNFYEGGEFLGSRESGQDGPSEISYQWGADRNRSIRLEVTGVPPASTGEIRMFTSPANPEGSRCGTFGWFAWTVDGETYGVRGEVWCDRLWLQVPQHGSSVRLRAYLKAGLGYTLWGSLDTTTLIAGV